MDQSGSVGQAWLGSDKRRPTRYRNVRRGRLGKYCIHPRTWSSWAWQAWSGVVLTGNACSGSVRKVRHGSEVYAIEEPGADRCGRQGLARLGPARHGMVRQVWHILTKCNGRSVDHNNIRGSTVV